LCQPLLVVLGSALALAASERPALGDEEFTEVGVVVNVLKNAAATDDEIKKGLEEANKILKQAKIKLVHKKTNRDVSDGGNDDGKTTREERDKLRKNGEKELDTVVGKGKGFKLTIALDCDTADAATVGLTVHQIPVTVGERSDPNDMPRFGYMIAHEFCHAFTLPGHDDPNGVEWDPNNLMDPSEGGGTTLTPDQIKEIKKKADERGDTKKKENAGQPAEKKLQETGSEADPRSGEDGEPPGIAPHSDQRRCGMNTDSSTGIVSGYVQMHGVFDPQSVTQNQCVTYIDADANPASGQFVVIDGQPLGAEYRVEIQLLGNGGGNIQLQGMIVDTTSGQSMPLSQLVLETENEVACFGGALEDLTPVLDQINYEFPRSFIASLALPCPVGVRMVDSIGGTVDDARFELRSHPPAAPELVLSAYHVAPTANVTATGTGFTPLTSVTVFIDDEPAATTGTDAQGGFSVSITAPSVGSTYYWIDARDSADGPSDFSILHVSPAAIPAADQPALIAFAGLLALVATIVIWRRRTQYA